MGFEGHVLDSINRTKTNRLALQYRRDRIAKVRKYYVGAIRRHSEHTPEKPVSPQVLEGIKVAIREKIRRDNIRTALLAVAVVVLLVAMVVAFFAFFVSPPDLF